MAAINEVCEFLQEAKTYYLATVEGDQPRVRPFGTAHIFEDKLYIQSGKSKDVAKQIEENPKFVPPERVNDLKKRAEGVIGVGNSMGEGWYLAAEMLEFADHGYENIVIVQPFGCLPCHVAAKGMINKVRRLDPRLNVVDIEYDPGATKVNQENRIKLMLVVAKEKLQ